MLSDENDGICPVVDPELLNCRDENGGRFLRWCYGKEEQAPPDVRSRDMTATRMKEKSDTENKRT